MEMFKEFLLPSLFLIACFCLVLGALLSTQQRHPRLKASPTPGPVHRAYDLKALPLPARQTQNQRYIQRTSFCMGCGKPLAASDEEACGFCGHPFDATRLTWPQMERPGQPLPMQKRQLPKPTVRITQHSPETGW